MSTQRKQRNNGIENTKTENDRNFRELSMDGVIVPIQSTISAKVTQCRDQDNKTRPENITHTQTTNPKVESKQAPRTQCNKTETSSATYEIAKNQAK